MRTADCDRRSHSGARKPRRAPWWCVLLIALVAVVSARPARAMEARVRDVHAGSDVVVAAVEIKDVVPDSLKHVITDGSTLHLRLQAELWESRPVWDRLVYPALVRVFRVARGTAPAQVVIADAGGATVPLPSGTAPFVTTLPLGRIDRISISHKYYVHLVATIGTIAEPDIDTVNDAVFGRESDSGSAAAFGRFVLRSVLQLSDYLESVTVDTKGRKVGGADILHR